MKLSEFLEEAAIMKEMKHPNLVQVSIYLFMYLYIYLSIYLYNYISIQLSVAIVSGAIFLWGAIENITIFLSQYLKNINLRGH